MDQAVIMWAGGILLGVIGGLVGWVKVSADRRMDKNEKESEKNEIAISDMKIEITAISTQQKGHGSELKELVKALAELGKAVSALSESNARFETWVEGLDSKLENIMLKTVATVTDSFRKELQDHARDSAAFRREYLQQHLRDEDKS